MLTNPASRLYLNPIKTQKDNFINSNNYDTPEFNIFLIDCRLDQASSIEVADYLQEIEEYLDDIEVELNGCQVSVIQTETSFIPSQHQLGVKD